jgi:hypothetical protein
MPMQPDPAPLAFSAEQLAEIVDAAKAVLGRSARCLSRSARRPAALRPFTAGDVRRAAIAAMRTVRAD